MNGLIRASLRNPYAVTVLCLTLILLGTVSAYLIPIDILPAFKSPAVQTLTFYGGMSAGESSPTTSPTGWNGGSGRPTARRVRSRARSSAPAIVRNYFQERRRSQRGVDAGQLAGPRGDPQPAAGHAAAGRPAVRPDRTTPVCIVAVDSRRPAERRVDPLRRRSLRGPQHDHGHPGAVAPVVFGGKIRAVSWPTSTARRCRRATSRRWT